MRNPIDASVSSPSASVGVEPAAALRERGADVGTGVCAIRSRVKISLRTVHA